MSAPVSAAQAGLFAGLAYTLPGAVWLGAELLGGLRSPPSEPLMRSAVEALLIGQAFAALLLPRGPANARANRPAVSLQPDLLGASLVLISAPAPLWVAIAFTRVIPLGWLTGTVALVAAFAILAPQVLATCENVLDGRLPIPLVRIATGILEASAALAIWTNSAILMRWA